MGKSRRQNELQTRQRDVKIRIVACGSTPWQLCRRYWGFSALIDGTVLFDTFCSGKVLIKRLSSMKADIARLQHVVISHDHWDHAGGLQDILALKKGLTVFVPALASDGLKRKIADAGALLHDVKAPANIGEEIIVAPEMRGVFDHGEVAEIGLAIKTNHGLCLVVGCAHPGIVEMVQRIKASTQDKVHAIIGGLHLMNASGEEARRCALSLRGEGVEVVMPTHCTGRKAKAIFKEIFGSGYKEIDEGSEIEINSPL